MIVGTEFDRSSGIDQELQGFWSRGPSGSVAVDKKDRVSQEAHGDATTARF
jgi:hypothetical protein